MLGILRSMLDSPEREARRLNRDATAIIDSTLDSFPIERVRDIAVMTIEHLGEAHAHLEDHSESREEVLARFRQLHSDSRRRMDQIGLTAYTLVIIHLRAEPLGDVAAPARDAIDTFTGQWSHAAETRDDAAG